MFSGDDANTFACRNLQQFIQQLCVILIHSFEALRLEELLCSLFFMPNLVLTFGHFLRPLSRRDAGGGPRVEKIAGRRSLRNPDQLFMVLFFLAVNMTVKQILKHLLFISTLAFEIVAIGKDASLHNY